MKPKRGVFHSFIAEKFKTALEEANYKIKNDKIIDYAIAKKILYFSHVPYLIQQPFLKEMEEMKLIKRVHKKGIKVFGKRLV